MEFERVSLSERVDTHLPLTVWYGFKVMFAHYNATLGESGFQCQVSCVRSISSLLREIRNWAFYSSCIDRRLKFTNATQATCERPSMWAASMLSGPYQYCVAAVFRRRWRFHIYSCLSDDIMMFYFGLIVLSEHISSFFLADRRKMLKA